MINITHPERIEFIHVLRGLAALSVALLHFCQRFWHNPNAVAYYANVTPYARSDPWISTVTAPVLMDIGVPVFFLISGFVIAMSIERESVPRYLIGRIFRLFPLMFVSLLAVALCQQIAASIYGTTSPFALANYAYQLVFMSDVANVASCSPVLWTLAIEWRFYLLMALLAPWVRRGSATPFLVIAAAAVIFSVATRSLDYSPAGTNWADLKLDLPYFAWWAALSVTMTYLVYMFIGVIVYFHFSGRITVQKALAYGAGLFSAFLIVALTGRMSASWSSHLMNYGAGLGIFLAAYLNRHYFRSTWPTNWLGDMSYSLYVIHPVIGYLIMRVLLDFGWSPTAITLAALLAAFAMAMSLYLGVEKPAIALGKRIKAQFLRRP